MGHHVRLRVARSHDLDGDELGAIHRLLVASFDCDFSDDDWDHTLGGCHFFVYEGTNIVSHASVVPRVLEVEGKAFPTGYIEGVGTAPEFRRRGHASTVVSAATRHIREIYALGALGTDLFDFYRRFGWERWVGKTFVREPTRLVHTAEEDGYVMVLRFGSSADIDLTAGISCDPRSGDVW